MTVEKVTSLSFTTKLKPPSFNPQLLMTLKFPICLNSNNRNNTSLRQCNEPKLLLYQTIGNQANLVPATLPSWLSRQYQLTSTWRGELEELDLALPNDTLAKTQSSNLPHHDCRVPYFAQLLPCFPCLRNNAAKSHDLLLHNRCSPRWLPSCAVCTVHFHHNNSSVNLSLNFESKSLSKRIKMYKKSAKEHTPLVLNLKCPVKKRQSYEHQMWRSVLL